MGLEKLLNACKTSMEKGKPDTGASAVWSILWETGHRGNTIAAKGLKMFFTSNHSFEEIKFNGKFRLFNFDVQIVKYIVPNYDILLTRVGDGYITYQDEDIRERILSVVIEVAYHFFGQPENIPDRKKIAKDFLKVMDEHEDWEKILFFNYQTTGEEDVLKIGDWNIGIAEVEHLVTNGNESKLSEMDTKDEHYSIDGTYSPKSNTIKIEKNLSNQGKLNVIIHEVFHSMIAYSNIRFTDLVKKHEGNNAEVEEEVVTSLSNIASMIILDNPNLIEKLSGLLLNDELDAEGIKEKMLQHNQKETIISDKDSDLKIKRLEEQLSMISE